MPSTCRMSPRGGKRPNQTGRPLRAGAPALHRATVWLTEAELAELVGALEDGEPLGNLLRDGGMELARRRNE